MLFSLSFFFFFLSYHNDLSTFSFFFFFFFFFLVSGSPLGTVWDKDERSDGCSRRREKKKEIKEIIMTKVPTSNVGKGID